MIKLQLDEKEIIKANNFAKERGFASVEDVVKEFIKQLPSLTPEPITLSDKAKKRYAGMDESFKIGKEVRIAETVDEFLSQLDA
jgi:hypothetical protein